MKKGEEKPDSRDLRDTVVELSRQGLTAKVISEKLGVTMRTVTRARAFRGIAKPGGIPMTEFELLRAKEMLEDGACYAEVARTIGRTHQTISRHLPGYQWTPEQIYEAAAIGRRVSKLMRGIA